MAHQYHVIYKTNQVALGECDDIEAALAKVEGSLWSLLEQPKMKRELEASEAERVKAEEVVHLL